MSFPAYPAYRESGVKSLGITPNHWPLTRLRFVAEFNPSRQEIASLPVDTEVSFLPMEAIGDNGALRLDSTRPLSSVDQGYTYFRDGDVIIAKITPCFENGKGALTSGLVGGIGFGTTELIVVRPIVRHALGNFLHWMFVSPVFRNTAVASMYGAGGQKRVPDAFVRDFVVALPSKHEQAAIAAFLDRETGMIDALVAEQERLIGLLQEKRQAVVSHAVTKGLDPSAPMKDSGVPWLGQVPAHWEVKRLGNRCAFLPGKAHEPYFDPDGTFICVTARFVSTSGKEAKRCSHNLTPAQRNDVLMVMSDLPNGRALARAFLVQDECAYAVNQRVCILRPRGDNPGFLYYQLDRNPSLVNNDDGINQTHLSNHDFTQLPILIPPRREQDLIADYLRQQTQRFTSLHLESHRAIALLRERRAALISAAVTGKIDVRGLVAPSAEAA